MLYRRRLYNENRLVRNKVRVSRWSIGKMTNKAAIEGVVSAEVKTLADIFKHKLKIPFYQRPYKWNRDNVSQLWLDLKKAFYDNKDQAYRLGTIVIHHNKQPEGENEQNASQEIQHDIVDGQQRLVTLVLLLLALQKEGELESGEDFSNLLEHHFEADISWHNLLENSQFLKECVGGLNDKKDFRNYLLNQCEFVYIVLNSLGQAFQFFDSQNARGKSLAAYDLLKAFHLRAIPAIDENKKLLEDYVSNWEGAVEGNDEGNTNDGKPILAKIINALLYRLRKIRRDEMDFFEFTTDDLDIFKGLDAKDREKYPYLKAMSGKNFQICQTLFNGEDFFKYIEYYREQYRKLFAKDEGLLAAPIFKSGDVQQHQKDDEKGDEKSSANQQGKDKAKTWYDLINQDDINRLTGDKNLRNFFELSIMLYYDKFGEDGLDAALHKAFVNAYQIRLLHHSQVRMGKDNVELLLKFIRCIDYAQQPSDIEKFTVDSASIRKKIKDKNNTANHETNTDKSFNYIAKYFKDKGLA
ncbi:DUF262 domain-containing protein [Pelistega suis]|uniref:DUF262 domain-containing protein n=1 Tax=Pelistega suis TaxID=1631957 RepID=UPI00211C6ADB|nr:DUF262 domain-containing protein [Pelistega suis]MCQ9329001.1 DUF262 domain-containing protein [Pelistega suis]